ncbi:AAA family ATPase [uncultured Methanomethylovorans sp.]|uniref:ATP-dependent nuclease n=1 Tax=uncultured Methanomethylovorans sp. TaxID=183759 RepID=UPI002AA6E94F|nr:AAA family ATPase [uncultured Methanomethylovorans sp.]
MEGDLENLVQLLQQMKEKGIFTKFIDYIRFPFYRNLEKDTKITFDFPLTVFVGQNGCGKSSAVQALFGCPEGKSVGNFWFSTKVDPIEDGEERPAFIYSYADENGTIGEVLKTRILRGSNPDYWEPSRPLIKYNMNSMGGSRFPALKMEVLYLDFRSILSAFDKYFYYGDPINLKSNTKQDYLRNRSILLKKVIDENSIKTTRSKPQNRKPIDFSPEELKIMSFILGKKYEYGMLIEHKFFTYWGSSIIFQTPNLAYSEAFAGSGESAVAILVHELLNVESNSLILFDEPETSLHPGAQKRLKIFILEQIKKKHLQVVISTHSSSLIEGIPSNAIKVFVQLPNGKFRVENERSPEEAFYYIGQTLPTKKKIIVEDKLAKYLIESVIKSIGDDCASLFDVEFYPGGHTIIKSDFIKVYSQNSDNNIFIIFDGDQSLAAIHLDVGTIPSSYFEVSKQDELVKYLQQNIDNQTGCKIPFRPDGGSSGGNREQLIELMKKYLVYYSSNVFYLPQSTPEAIIWNDNFAIEYMKLISLNDSSVIDDINATSDFKLKFKKYSKHCFGSEDLQSAYRQFLTIWRNNKDENFEKIKQIVIQIRDA